MRIGTEKERRGRHEVTTHEESHVKTPARKTQQMLYVGPAGQRNQCLMVHEHAQLDRYCTIRKTPRHQRHRTRGAEARPSSTTAPHRGRAKKNSRVQIMLPISDLSVF